jgi:dihydroneopterin aldolase
MDEYGKRLNKVWTEEEVEKEVNIDLEIKWEQIKTDMKNTLGYKEKNKDIKEWFDEECGQLLEQE